jgi:hypothetical protein
LAATWHFAFWVFQLFNWCVETPEHFGIKRHEMVKSPRKVVRWRHRFGTPQDRRGARCDCGTWHCDMACFRGFFNSVGKIGTFGTQVPSDHKRALSASSWNGMFWGTQGMHKIVGVTWTEPRRLEPCWCTTLPEKEHSKVVPNGWRRGGKFLNPKFVLMANWSPRNRCFPSFNPVFLPVLAFFGLEIIKHSTH